ncbi:MAG: TIGR02147 family protein [Chitinivibrionales bacterium]|nr:TIGR02147 family protein [Chitinivibrionales bacterium]
MQSLLKSIFEFTDYHQFFKAYYQHCKATKRSFSFRCFAQHTGVAASLLVAVISGQRRISATVAKKYAVGIGLTARETAYLLALVDFERAKTHTQKNDAFSRIVRLRGQSKLTFLDADQYEYFSHWYHAAIREFIALPFFKEDPAWIARQLLPAITESKTRRSLELLQRLGLAARNKNGKLFVVNKAVSSEYEIHTLSLRNFSREMIDRAREALDTVPVELREISGLTLGISDECFERIKQRVRIFKEEVVSMVVDDQNVSNKVYQLNFQFFPLFAPLDKDKKV